MVLLENHFRGFRRRLLGSISKHRHHSVDVTNGTGLILHNLSNLYDKRHRSLLVTEKSIDFLQQICVFCEAVACSELDDLLESNGCRNIIGLLMTCYEEASSQQQQPHSDRPPSPSLFESLVSGTVAAEANGDLKHRISRMNAEVPYIVRPSRTLDSVACRAYVDVKSQQQVILGKHSMPPEISKEAVYLQYCSDTGLDRFLADTITDLTWKSIPVNAYKVLSDQINQHVLKFDTFHQSSKELLATVLHDSTELIPWADSDIYYVDHEVDMASISAPSDVLDLFVAESGGKYVLGSRLALSAAPVRSTTLWALQASLDGLLVDERYVKGAFSVDICTGVAGAAIAVGGMVPLAKPPLQIRMAQDICIEGSDPIDAANLFVDICAQHIVDLFEKCEGVYVVELGSGEGTETNSAVDFRDVVGADMKERVASAIGDSLQDTNAIRLTGFVLHNGLYAPFHKTFALHYGDAASNPISFITHVWPDDCHLHERIYFSENSVPGLFRRCHGTHPLRLDVPQDRDWLARKIRRNALAQDIIAACINLGLYSSLGGREMMAAVDAPDPIQAQPDREGVAELGAEPQVVPTKPEPSVEASAPVPAAGFAANPGSVSASPDPDLGPASSAPTPAEDMIVDPLAPPQQKPAVDAKILQHVLMGRVKASTEDAINTERFVECCRVLHSTAFHLQNIQMNLGTIRVLACESSGLMLAKMNRKVVACLYMSVASQLRQYSSVAVGRAVYFHGGQAKLLRILDELQEALLGDDVSIEMAALLELDEPTRAVVRTKIQYAEQYVNLLKDTTAQDMRKACPAADSFF